MRVVLICPYSLSLPGGVQGQVPGLARTLRQRGVSATVLGPCDGPPPEAGVISVGPSVSLAANGSVAPLAPDPPAIRRTLEVLASERPDILHLHEPLVPGPALTALLAGNVPTVGTFHSTGGLLFWLDCSDGYYVTDTIDSAATGPLATLSFGDDPRHQYDSASDRLTCAVPGRVYEWTRFGTYLGPEPASNLTQHRVIVRDGQVWVRYVEEGMLWPSVPDEAAEY